MEDIAPNDPMPCGFVRVGITIKDRLKHYRQCQHPACKAKSDRFKPLIEAAIMTPEGQPTFGASELLAPIGKPHPFTVILPSGNGKKFMTMADAERYVTQCAGKTNVEATFENGVHYFTNLGGSVWSITENKE